MDENIGKHNGKCKLRKECSGYCCTKIQGFSVKIGKTEILREVNLHLHCGELTAVIGPNGAGKSTLLKAILGEIRHEGTIAFAGATGNITGMPMIGYVPQQLEFDTAAPVSVKNLFVACMSRKPAWYKSSKQLDEKILKCLGRVQAEGLINKRLGSLSGGELQRVLLALALEPMPQLLLLDEPVSGVDRKGLEVFYEIVSKVRELYDLSIILVSHDLDLVKKHADRVVLIDGTVILNGTPETVFSDKRLHETFGLTGFFDSEKAENRGKADEPDL
ncbi:zinc transport system ATP-binding protein [Ruminiclostridium sufflavum DSM 19573]|uniref:Zinc transport system ATP-binding protein n=1 Tax=Ruminiclostridium sufflavum DSM 19573 TaxID=1121337 RepID=A0A318XL03_9FIRM|nr:metal ABC transporter ATP-binding protein [Ruminiclostridium sufflavum]PYG87138.1 zinc transport system ATP-binding protein [Ruminiclostridium sufflavum DSM 19573]